MAPAQAQAEAFSQQTPATLTVFAPGVFTQINVDVPAYHESGSGTAFGVGAEAGGFQGTLSFNSAGEIFGPRSLDFEIASVSGGPAGVIINFSSFGQQVGSLLAIGIGAGGAVGLHGTFTWNN